MLSTAAAWTLVILTAVNLGDGSGWHIVTATAPARYDTGRACAEAYEGERWRASADALKVLAKFLRAQFRDVGFRCTRDDPTG